MSSKNSRNIKVEYFKQNERLQTERSASFHLSNDAKTAIGFLAIPTAIFIAVFIYSIIFSMDLSLSEWDLISIPKFVGLANYLTIFNSSSFYMGFLNTFIWTLSILVFTPLIGLFLALILNNDLKVRISLSPFSISLLSCRILLSV